MEEASSKNFPGPDLFDLDPGAEGMLELHPYLWTLASGLQGKWNPCG